MEATDELAKNLVNNPRESLNLEVKRWLNPTNPDGQAKIVKALLALRNRDGGALIVGFDNDTLLPDAENVIAHALIPGANSASN
jgi:predicted HTH transcriptional regulator